MPSLARGALLATLLLGGLATESIAQVFMASRPNPPVTIGPLYIRASVSPEMPHLPIDITWTPRMTEPGWLMRLSLKTKGLIKAKPGTWTERAFWGPRSRLLLSFQDV